MIIHLLAGLIFIHALIRLILPLRLNRAIKLAAAAMLLLVSQQHLIIRHVSGGIASPELPVPVLLASAWSFISLIFLFLLLLARDMVLLLRRLAGAPPFSRSRRHLIITAVAAIPAAYGVRQGITAPEARHVEARLRRLPEELDGLSLVQISDLHISPLLREERVRAVVDKVNALDPDLILFTGDTVDGAPERRAENIAPLKDLRARYGIFGCTGNHEYYGGYAAWMKTFPALGLTMLLNSHAALMIRGRQLVLAGVTDSAAARYSLPGPDVGLAFAGAPEGAARILLDHRPGNARNNAGAGVDLQLSGHTHGGHMPGMDHLVARFNQGYVRGWYQVDAMRLYVSSGAGLWSGFPVRLGVPSEIAHIVLRCR